MYNNLIDSRCVLNKILIRTGWSKSEYRRALQIFLLDVSDLVFFGSQCAASVATKNINDTQFVQRYQDKLTLLTNRILASTESWKFQAEVSTI